MSVVGEEAGSEASKLKTYVTQLQSAIDELNTVRKHLQRNAHQVRCEIHSTVSRELEALRNREVWLLSQVDLLQHVKEDILRGQQAQISTELGRALAQTDGQDIMHDVTTNMNRLELTDLAPEETAHMSFQADAAGLRNTIMEFGRLDAGGRGLQKAFAAAHTPSASLPKPFEEYDDAEHHVLYKTLEEINRGKTESASIQVNIPKLALKKEDWLIRPTPGGESETAPKPDKLEFPTLSTEMSDWVLAGRGATGAMGASKPLLTRNRSIQDWLLQIKHFPHTHDEEDDFDFVEHVTISEASDYGMDVPTSVSSPVVATPTNSISSSQFCQVTPTTMTTWLLGGVTTPSTSGSGEDTAFHRMFRHNSSDTAGWLLNSDSCSKACSQSPEPVEIENLGSLACISDRTIFSHQVDDKARWLLGPRDASATPPVTAVCKANEPCVRHDDCLSTPRCASENLHSSQGENVWLVNSACPQQEETEKYRFSHKHNMSDNYADWLHSSKQLTNAFPACGEKLDANVLASWFASVSNKTCDWLKSNGPAETLSDASCKNGDDTSKPSCFDLDVWLRKTNTVVGGDTSIGLPFSEIYKSVFPANLSTWLAKYEEDDGNTQMDTDDCESEKKDTTSEKVEMAKWLLNAAKTIPGSTCQTSVKNSGLGLWLFDKHLEW